MELPALPQLVMWFWLACVAVGGLAIIVPPVKQATSYGKLRDAKLSSWWSSLTLPKYMFTHFYAVAVAWNGFLLALSAVYGTCYTQQMFGVAEARCAQPRVILVAALLVQIHVTRRLYECLFVHLFSPRARMHYLVYAFGLIHYLGVGVTLYMPSGTDTPTYYGELGFLGIALILGAGFWQNRTHTVLARLRRPRRGQRTKPVVKAPKAAAAKAPANRYSIPSGWGFGTVACPHYTADALVYIGIVLLTGGQNVCAAAMALWVVTNLTITATRTREWYRQEFPQYPTTIRAIWPGMW